MVEISSPPAATDTWYVPSGLIGATQHMLVPVFNGTGGNPTHAVWVATLTTNTIAVQELRRSGNEWIHDGTLARDASITLSQTMTAVNVLTAFAIENPVATTTRVLYVVYNNAGATPDALVIDSIDLSGGETLSAVAVTIAGANSPAATDLIAAVGCAFTASTVGLIYKDDLYRATITGDESGFTFTFTLAVVTAIDTSIDVDTTLASNYSMYLVGTTVLLMRYVTTLVALNYLSMWTMTTAGVKIAEYLNVAVGGQTNRDGQAISRSKVFAVDGQLAIAAGGDISTNFVVRKIPLAQLVAN